MPIFVVTYIEEQEVVVVVEAASKETAEEAVDAAADAGEFVGENWEYTTNVDAEESDGSEGPAYRVDADARKLRKI